MSFQISSSKRRKGRPQSTFISSSTVNSSQDREDDTRRELNSESDSESDFDELQTSSLTPSTSSPHQELEVIDLNEESGTEVNLLVEPKAKRRKKNRKSTNLKRALNSTSSTEPVESKLLTLDIAIYTWIEMKKTLKKRHPKATFLVVDSNTDFDIFKIQLSEKIEVSLQKNFVILDNYNISFTIKRVQPNAYTLDSDDAYALLLQRALSTKNPSILLSVCEKQPATATAISSASLASGTDNAVTNTAQGEELIDDLLDGVRPKKSKVPKAGNIDAKHEEKNRLITALEHKWRCNDKECPPGAICYPLPNTKKHLFCSNHHLDRWAAGILANIATMEQPPEDPLFDAIPNGSKGQASPLLERRHMELKNQGKTEETKPNIIVNIPNLYPPMPHASHAPPAAIETMLVPTGSRPGREYTIQDFCYRYGLSQTIMSKLIDNEFTGTQAFVHTSLQDLKDMEMRIGAVRELQAAVVKWIDHGI